MDLLGNRASTQAKIQHYDTTRDQISVRKAELARSMLEISEEGERLETRLKEYEEELEKVQTTIRGYNDQISENEKKIEQMQRELSEKTGETAHWPDCIFTENLPGWNPLKILPSVMTATETVSAKLWRTKTVKKV